VVLDHYVLAFDVTGFGKTFAERDHAAGIDIGRPDADKPNHRHHSLLRASRKRPYQRRAAKRGYELPPSDADCHLPRPLSDRARCNMGKNITLQSAGL
jgi:hypothetical protein